MSRGLTAAMDAAITDADLKPCLFFEGQFSSGNIYLWTGIGDVSWNGQTWIGAGNLIGVSEVSETADVVANGITVSLSGVPVSYISLAINDAQQGLPGKVYLGLMTGGRRNLLTWTEQMDDATWNKIRTNVVANAVSSPFGSATAEKIIEDTSTNNHYISKSGATLAANTAHTFSVFAKAAERDHFELWGYNGSHGRIQARFDLQAGVVESMSASGGGGYSPVVTGATIEPVGGGWFRCSVSGYTDASGSSFLAFLHNGSGFGYTGDGTSGLYLWGAQVERGHVATDYQKVESGTEFAGANGEIVADPVQSFAGRLDVPEIIDGAETCTISITYESRLVDLLKPREFRYTHESQKLFDATDKGFEFVTSLQNKEIAWGQK